MKLIGPHVSADGGVENAPLRASAVGATGFALFTRNQRTWRSQPLSEESIVAFRDRCRQAGYGPGSILPHDSYLINLGAPDPRILARSREAFVDELGRCAQLGLTMLNFHPGSHKGLMSDEGCLDIVAASVEFGLERTEGVTAVVEITAGQGSNVGRTFEQLARLIERVSQQERIGVCLDTAHAFAAGYDLRAGCEEALSELDRIVGLRRLRGMHLNDSKAALGSRVDRHAALGGGEIGWEAFRCLMKDPRTDGIPLILETPDEDRWPDEIAKLAAYAREGARQD
jgi:deoxyribonuclease-4